MKQMLKIVIVVMIFLMGMTLTAYADSNELAVYDNNAYGFQMKYPISWKASEGFMGSVVIFISPRENANDKASENVNIGVEDLTAYPDMTLGKFEKLSLDQIQHFITNFKLISEGDDEIAGFPAKTLTYLGRQGVLKLEFYQVFMIANNKVYAFTFTAEEGQYANYEERAKDIIKSFNFREKFI